MIVASKQAGLIAPPPGTGDVTSGMQTSTSNGAIGVIADANDSIPGSLIAGTEVAGFHVGTQNGN